MTKEQKLKFCGIMLLGIALRALLITQIPAGLNQDEAYAGYEAFCMLFYGRDSHGYVNPSYLVTWGSGMSALQSYMTIPFMALLGPVPLALRLPPLIMGCLMLAISLPLGRLLMPERPLLLSALLAVSPYYIMVSRWGLDANLAPPLLFIGLFFLLRGAENRRALIPAALILGLSLYAYSLMWLVVPLSLVLWGIYVLWTKKLRFRELLLPGLLIFLMALPHILFMLINKGLIPEIRTDLFSIPRLVYMRSGELSIKNLLSAKHWKELLNILFKQSDGYSYNTLPRFGLFYHISLPFIVAGWLRQGFCLAKSLRHREYSHEAVLSLSGFAAFFCCMLLRSVNISRSNYLHIYTLLSLALGTDALLSMLVRPKGAQRLLCAAYALCLIFFSAFYFGPYRQQSGDMFRAGLGEALDFAQKQQAELIYIDEGIYYPQLLFYTRTDPNEYAATVRYRNYPAPWLDVESFGIYRFGIDCVPQRDAVYVLYEKDRQPFLDAGCSITDFGRFSVAVWA